MINVLLTQDEYIVLRESLDYAYETACEEGNEEMQQLIDVLERKLIESEAV